MAERLNEGDDAFSATEFNRHGDAADIVLGQGQRPRPNLRPQTDSNSITVKNSSGADRRRGEILEFTGCPLTNFNAGKLWLTGGAVTLANGFGVLLNPIPNGTFGNEDCQIAGTCFALVNVTSSGHKYATPTSGNYVLQSASSGPVRILYKPGTGEQNCAVLLGQATPPRRAMFRASGWHSASTDVIWGGLARGEGLATLQDSNKEILIQTAGEYLLTVHLTSVVEWASPALPAWSLALRELCSAGSLDQQVDMVSFAATADSGGSPGHTHNIRALNCLMVNTVESGNTFKHHWQTIYQLAAGDTLRYRLQTFSTPTWVADIRPWLNSFVSLEPLF